MLSYNDVLLRRADVELLTGPRWLNDQVISFYFEYITQERLQGEQMLLIHFVSQPLTLGNSAAMEAIWNFERREERHA